MLLDKRQRGKISFFKNERLRRHKHMLLISNSFEVGAERLLKCLLWPQILRFASEKIATNLPGQIQSPNGTPSFLDVSNPEK